VMKTNYPSLNPATFQPFGGHYIIHFGRMATFDGKPPNPIVVIAFDSIANAQAWRASVLSGKHTMLKRLRTFEPSP
jgi:uncharacterized protein (DUF1330 family)